jgi:Cof subfamily protein (haloacid dehalogenase superfamily)
MATQRYEILALDVDGTLLDPDGTLRPRTAEAVARAARAGIRPVLCTGRRYRRAQPIAHQLGIDAPLVCNSGAIIKDPKNHRTLWRADFDQKLAADVLRLFDDHDQPAVVFTDRDPVESDFIIAAYPTGRPFFDDYVGQNREHAEIRTPPPLAPPFAADRDQSSSGPDSLFHVCAIGSENEMLAFEDFALKRVAGRVQTYVQRSQRYLGTMCEFLRHDASKWTAILHLARMWGIDPGAICAVGDDVNDIPMIKNAGLGVAMGHARLEVRGAADLITGGHDEDGVAMLVDDVLLPAMAGPPIRPFPHD